MNLETTKTATVKDADQYPVLEATGMKNNFVAGKSDEPISSSSRTDMLCRTWIIQKVTDADGNEIYDDDDFLGSIVLFSKAGTYLVLYGGEGGEAGLSEWKWANSEQTKLYYSWDNWEDDNIFIAAQLRQ